MTLTISVQWDKRGLAGLETGKLKSAAVRALRKAGQTALRDMRSEASKRIKAGKRLKSKYITRALSLGRLKGSQIADLAWSLDVSGEPVPLIAYPHRQTRQGVSVEVNTGKRTLIRGAFLATMKSGRVGIFRRRGKARLPIEELLGSRPVDALLHQGEADAVAARGGQSFAATFMRLLPMEIEER